MSDTPTPPATVGLTQRVELRPYTPPYATQSAVGTAPPAPQPTDEKVTVVLDGVERTVPKGQLIITAADEAGVYIPRFCYHPRMKPVGMCRMCLVEVAGPRGSTLMPACYNPVADGMEIRTTSEMTKKAQDGVLEFLLVNHPLDCPVCDKGGECPLQDQTLRYGPGESRFVEEKRHWEKPIPISDLVNLDRERCIQCGRCVRFADEVAGDPLIDFAERGDRTEVATFPDTPYASYFSGNVVQICPVGALLAKPYRFRARPWDLDQVESTCTSCAFGCRTAVQASSDELVRTIGIDADPVNHGWLCDKGRFDFQAVNAAERLRAPLVRRGDQLVEASWAEALAVAADGIRRARAHGGDQVALLGGARLPNEDAYAWSKVARTVFGTDHVDAQLGDGLPAEVVLGLPRATIDQAAAAPVVVLLTGDVKDELPVLYLRLRESAQAGRTLLEVAPGATGMTRYTTASLRYRPGHLADAVRTLLGEQRARFDEAGEGGVVVVLGRPSLAEAPDGVVEAARLLADLPGVRFLSGLRRANVHGALDMGLAPGVLPGRVGLDDGREWFEHHWGGPLPERAGRDAAGILTDAAAGRIGALVLVGADPVADFPDHQLALRGVDGARFVVAVDTFLNDSNRRADVVLPAATYAERRGTTTNIEGRITWLGQIVTAPGVAWPDWMIASELASALGTDLGWSSLADIWAEVERVSPVHAGVTYALLTSREARDGVVVPLGATAELHVPRRLDPMADPGILQPESHGISAPDFMVQTPEVTRPALVDEEPAAQGDGQADTAVAVPTDGGEGAVNAPAALRFSAGTPVTNASATTTDDVLLLVSGRTMFDAGTQVAHSHSLAPLHPGAALRMSAYDATRRGLAAGATVRVESSRGLADLPLRIDDGVAPGTVAITFNLPGGHAGDLIDVRAASTAVTVRALRTVTGAV
ncbi:MAG TPA: NADH-quinone oxidoreductase subunit NuoG [Acidimicrobiales bacterium]|nr:NADH-quinone oxidoreductase subunit NuoG [Acidimicrobiales bacterium]